MRRVCTLEMNDYWWCETLTAYEFSWYLTKQHLDNATLVLATPATQGSAIFVQYNLTYNNANTGFYAYVGETITGATSGSTGMLVSFDSSNFILQYCSGSEFLGYASGTGAFTSGLTVTGATSGAQGIITAISGTTSSGTLTLTPTNFLQPASGKKLAIAICYSATRDPDRIVRLSAGCPAGALLPGRSAS